MLIAMLVWQEIGSRRKAASFSCDAVHREGTDAG
jgi:hypothetical protein